MSSSKGSGHLAKGPGQQVKARGAARVRSELEHLRHENLQLRKMLEVDELTGLGNLRGFRSILSEVVHSRNRQAQQCGVSSDSYALMFLDVDYFKSINETYGHLAASQLLERLGRFLNFQLRAEDHAFRYGGDEFVILAKANRQEAVALAERIRLAVQNERFGVRGFDGRAWVSLSVSVGVRVITAGDTVEGIIESSDRAMFEAKRKSRNCVVLAA